MTHTGAQATTILWNRRRILSAGVIGLGTLSLTALAGCSPVADVGPIPDSPVRGGILEYGHDVQPVAGGLDPYGTTAFASQNIYVQIYESLVSIDADGELHPAIAKSWEHPSDTEWVFTLRSDAAFSNGEPVTADDVVYSYETMVEEGRLQPPYLTAMESVEKLADDRVHFTLSRPSQAFINAVASPLTGAIVNKEWYSSASADDRARKPLGSGAFMLADWQDNIVLKLVRNEHYWGADDVHLGGVNFRIIPDDQARIAALRQGTVDAIWIGDQQLAEQVMDEGFTIANAAETRNMWCYVNAEEGPLKELKVRQAVSCALDRNKIAELASYGYGKLSLTCPYGDPSSVSVDDSTPLYTQDQKLARQLLEESGVAEPTVTLTYPSDASFARDLPIYEIMKSQLSEVGINLELLGVPWADMLSRRVQGDFTGLMAVPGTAYPDVKGYFNVNLNPDSPSVRLGEEHLTAWEMTQDMDAETDPKRRTEKLRALEHEVAEKVLVLVPFAMAQRQEIWGPRWQGYQPDPYSYRENIKNSWVVP